MNREAKKYHDNMTKVFKSANTNHKVNIERHEKNLQKIEEEKKVGDTKLEEPEED